LIDWKNHALITALEVSPASMMISQTKDHLMTDEQTQRDIQKALADGAKLLPESIRKIDECFCGCGEPEKAWRWVLVYLTELETRTAHVPTTGLEYIAVYLLNHLGITEHGTSVRGAFLTEAGKEAQAFLSQHGCEWNDTGYWIDSKGFSHGEPEGA
jgi:hypothetical protein